jgi:phage baseplate assembly protein W
MANAMMGIDMKLGNYDINFTSTNDVKLNTYEENISQAIINRLLTPKGFFTKHPNYGSYLYQVIGMPTTNATLIFAKHMIHWTLLQEPRVQSIEKITVKYTNVDTLNIFIQVILIEEIAPFNIVFSYFLR